MMLVVEWGIGENRKRVKQSDIDWIRERRERKKEDGKE